MALLDLMSSSSSLINPSLSEHTTLIVSGKTVIFSLTQELATHRHESGRSGYFAVIAARQVSLHALAAWLKRQQASTHY